MTLEQFYYNQSPSNNILDNQELYLIDTNIFVTVYTNGNTNDKSEKIQAYFELLSENNLRNGYVSVQNLVEFVNVTKNKLKCFNNPAGLNDRLKNISSLFHILTYSSSTVMQAVDLSYSTGVHFFDALLAQTMLENNVRVIYTENTLGFNKIPGIKAINPFTDKKIARLCEKARKQKIRYSVQEKKKSSSK